MYWRSRKINTSSTEPTVNTSVHGRNSFFSVDLTDLSGSVSLAFADLNVTTLYEMDALLMKIAAMQGQGQYNGTLSKYMYILCS